MAFLTFRAEAQVWKIDDLMKLKPTGISTQRVDTSMAVFLPMPFSEARFIETAQLKKIASVSKIYGIHLVYTRFREVDTFNQPKLNYYRFQELQKVYPEVFNTTGIDWMVLEQRDAKTKEKAMQCFHGFVIYLKNEVPKDLITHEVNNITSVIDSYKDTLVFVPEKIEWKVKRRKVETGYYLPRSDKKRENGEKFSSSGIWFREPEYEVHYDSTIKKKSGGYWKKIGEFDTTVFKGTAEFDFLARRQWSSKMAVVTDVTGSMSPYSTQIMLWLKYSPHILKQGRFTFFNDGDGTPDPFKKIGRTGGIYFAENAVFDSVFSVMKSTMSRGLGGDFPENNLEAILKTLKRWPDTDTILLIADNLAAVKDISLLSQIKKPVSVMVCGVTNGIHPDYVQVARTTGGKLFVLNTEISNLKGLQSGQRVMLGGKWYEWRKNTFVLVH